MTEFVEVSSGAGSVFLPVGLVRPVPFTGGADIDALTADEAVEALGAVRRARARADAVEARAVARLSRLRDGDRSVAKEVSLELRTSEAAAANRVARGESLVRRMPLLLAAMEAGDIEGFPAGRILEVTAMLEDAQVRRVDEQLAVKLARGRLRFTDPSSLVKATRRLVNALDSEGQAERARRARAERKVLLIPGENATSTLAADLPAEVAASAYARIDGMARRIRNRGDERTLEQVRADVFADLLLGHDPGVSAPKGAALVFLHLPMDTALTMSDTGCELSGYGPLPGVVGREIMTHPDSVLRTVLTDPATGAVRDLGRSRRNPSTFLRDFVAARDRECSGVGCHRPAPRCDFDHLNSWHDFGVTAEHNGGAKCERCHYRKDEPGWTLTHDPGTGVSTITTPTGRTYTKTIQPIIEPPPKRSTPDVFRWQPCESANALPQAVPPY